MNGVTTRQTAGWDDYKTPYVYANGGTVTPSITVTSPNGGETIQFGNTYSINWTSSTYTNPVSIMLVDYSTGINGAVCVIADGLASSPGNNTYNWKAGTSRCSQNHTGNYKIQVYQQNSNPFVGDMSDNYFTIAAAGTCVPSVVCTSWSACVNGQQTRTCTDSNNCTPAPITTQTCITTQPSITVTSPISGQIWRRGSTYNITWRATGADKVAIYLINPVLSSMARLAYNIPASQGSYSWAIPAGLSTRNDYKIQIVPDNTTAAAANSGVFSILASTTSMNPDTASQIASISAALAQIMQQLQSLTGQ